LVVDFVPLFGVYNLRLGALELISRCCEGPWMQGAPRARGGGGFAMPDGACMHSSLRAASGAVCRSGGQVSHERSFIKAPLGLSVLAGLAARHATTSPPAASPLARRRPPQIQPTAPKRALRIGRSTVKASICAHRRSQFGQALSTQIAGDRPGEVA
jgi:hypothetical protein